MTSRSHRGRWAAVVPDTRGSRLRDTRVARALIAHPHRTAAGLLALLVLAYLWPVLLGGQTLAPTALLQIAPPWTVTPRIVPYLNQELGDVPLSYYPWDVLARQLLRSGTFPAWNPHAFAGTPLFANMEIAWLSPFSLPLWILPLNYGLGVAAALKLWMAGFGSYLLARELRLGFWPAMVASISFALCAFNVVWLTYGVFVSVAALLPWAIWLAERLVRRGRPSDGLWLAAIVAAALAGGHPGTQVHVLAAVAIWVLVRTVAGNERPRAERIRSLALVGAALALGTLLTAVVLLPAQQAAADTYGALIRRNGASALPGAHVPFGALRTALFPEWWGRPVQHLMGGGSRFRERTFYAGAIPLMLAALAVVSPGASRRKLPLAILAILGIAIPLHAPLIYPAVVRLPFFDQIQNQRMLLWFVFAVAMLAGFGLQAAIDARGRGRAWAVVGVAALAGALAAAAVGVEGRHLQRAVSYAAHRTDRAQPATLALASVAWWLIAALGLAAALAAMRRAPGRTFFAGFLVALLVAFDLLHFAHGYNPMGPPSVVLPPRTPAIAFLQAHARAGRIVGIGYALPADWSTVYGLRDVRGHDSPQPSLRLSHLWQAFEQVGDGSRILTFTPASVRLTGLLGARYIVTEPGVEPMTAELQVAYRGSDATVLADRRAVPRAFVPHRVATAPDEAAEIGSVAEEGFDPRRTAVVSAGESAGAVPSGGAGGTARVVSEENASVALRARLARRGLVVLDDQWAPGWSVSVDGRAAPPVRTDVVLRGVVVPAGTHRIVWSYRVPGLRAGAALSAVGLALALAWAGALVARRRSRQTVAR